MKQKHISTLLALGVGLAFICIIVLSVMVNMSFAAMTGKEAHEKYIYPMVRLTFGNVGGSGTIIHSKLNDENIFSTYVLTNHHVISDAIRIEEKWDSVLQKNVKTEKRSIVYVEIFQYRDLSIPIGTLKIEAEIILYDEDQDLALVKLRSENEVKNIAKLFLGDAYHVMDESIAVGCSLGFPPLPTVGVITRKNFYIDSLPYDMSSSQIIYGNSGGAMFLAQTGELIGIPSRVVDIGWGTVIPHMGLFIPIDRIIKWLNTEHYDFLFNEKITEKECLDLRKKEIENKKNSQ